MRSLGQLTVCAGVCHHACVWGEQTEPREWELGVTHFPTMSLPVLGTESLADQETIGPLNPGGYCEDLEKARCGCQGKATQLSR